MPAAPLPSIMVTLHDAPANPTASPDTSPNASPKPKPNAGLGLKPRSRTAVSFGNHFSRPPSAYSGSLEESRRATIALNHMLAGLRSERDGRGEGRGESRSSSGSSTASGGASASAGTSGGGPGGHF